MRVPLLVKVNLVVLPVMIATLGVAIVTLKRAADRTALEETKETARLIIATAQATYDYTVEQVKPALEAIVEMRDVGGGRFEYMAIPIRITNEGCLACHSTPDAAPKLMTDSYGRDSGFDWHLNDVVAAQVVSVPVAIAQQRADTLFGNVVTILIGAFVLTMLLVNAAIYIVAGRHAPPSAPSASV
jgi:hypothetical protein